MEEEMDIDLWMSEANNFVLDADYEFNCPFYSSFTESSAEEREAELWFDSAPSYPEAPFVANQRKLLENSETSDNGIAPEDVKSRGFGKGLQSGSLQKVPNQPLATTGLKFNNRISHEKVKAKATTKPQLPRSSTLLKLTKSQLAKQIRPTEKVKAKATTKSQLPRSSTLLKPTKSQLAKQIPPTAQVGSGSFRPNNISQQENVTAAAHMFRARPLNRKILEAPTFPLLKKSTQRLPEKKVTHRPATRTQRTTRKILDKDLDKENKNVNMPGTSANGNMRKDIETAVVQTGMRRMQVVSTRRKVEEGPEKCNDMEVDDCKVGIQNAKHDANDVKFAAEGMELEELPFADSLIDKAMDAGLQCTTGAYQKYLESIDKVVDGAVLFHAEAQEDLELRFDLESNFESHEADSDQLAVTGYSGTNVNKYSNELVMKVGVESVEMEPAHIDNVVTVADPNIEMDKFGIERLIDVDLITTGSSLPCEKSISFSKLATSSAGNGKRASGRPSSMIALKPDKHVFKDCPLKQEVEERCTRKSVRLLEQNISQLRLKEEGKAKLVKTDVSSESEEKDVSEGVLEKNNSEVSSAPSVIEVIDNDMESKDDFQDKKMNNDNGFYDSISDKVMDGGIQCTTGADEKNLESAAKVVDGVIPLQEKAHEVTEHHLDLERDFERPEADSDEFIIVDCSAAYAFPSDITVNKYSVSEKTLSDGLDLDTKDAVESVEKVIYVDNVVENENLDDPNVEMDKFDTKGLFGVSLIQAEVPLPSKKNVSFSKSATDSILKDKNPSTASLAGNEKIEFKRPSSMIRHKHNFKARPLNEKAGTAVMHARSRLTIPSEPKLRTAQRAQKKRPSGMIAPKLERDDHNFKAYPLNKKILSSKGDMGVFLSRKRETTIPKEFNLGTKKRIQHHPSMIQAKPMRFELRFTFVDET